MGGGLCTEKEECEAGVHWPRLWERRIHQVKQQQSFISCSVRPLEGMDKIIGVSGTLWQSLTCSLDMST